MCAHPLGLKLYRLLSLKGLFWLQAVREQAASEDNPETSAVTRGEMATALVRVNVLKTGAGWGQEIDRLGIVR